MSTPGPGARLVMRAALVLVALLAAASCSSSYDRFSATPATSSTTTTTNPRATTTAPPTSSTTTTTRPPGPANTTTTIPAAPTTTVPGSPAGLPGRLAVVALDGSLLTVRPDGSDPRALATASPGTSVASPTWTADASRLVWTALGTNSVRVRSATVDLTDLRDATLSPVASLFLPSPSGAELVAIRETSASANELTRLDPGTLAATMLRTAGTVHATWSPDGSQLLVHAGSDVLVVRQGTATTVPVTAGSFGAGQWLDDRTVVVATRTAQGQALTAVDLTNGTSRDLLGFTGAIRFLVDPTKRTIAYQVLPDSGSSSGSNVSFRPQTTAPATTVAPPQATTGQLALLTLATRQITVVSTTPVQMFQWSPTGERLAHLASDTAGVLRWRFWSAKGTLDGAVIAPPNTFLRTYGRWFDDAAGVVRWWSPDGAAFVYAGRSGPRTGVFVQQMDGSAPVLVSDGDTAVWSPR